MTRHSDFPKLVEAFFTERLLQQRKASPETIAGYRDAFRLLLRFAARRLKKEPSKLALKELDARFIGEFLDHLEAERSNSIRTRNARLAAIHSFFRYVSFEGEGQSHTSRVRRSTRWLRRPIRPPGSAGGTRSSYWSRSRRACGSRNLSACNARTSCWGAVLMCVAREREESNDVRRFARKL